MKENKRLVDLGKEASGYSERQVYVPKSEDYNHSEDIKKLNKRMAKKFKKMKIKKYSFSVGEHIKKPKFRFAPDNTFLHFANWFAINYKKLPEGNYVSDDNKYIIQYKNLTEEHSKRPIATFARVSTQTGVIQFNRDKVIKNKKVTPNFVFYLSLWSWARFNTGTDNISKADLIATKYYLKTGRSKKEIAFGWLDMFNKTNTTENRERYKKIKSILSKKTKK